jgi:hypothetical protein
MLSIAKWTTLATAAMMLTGAAQAGNQIPGPSGWSASLSNGAGVVAGYRLPEKDGTFRHVVGAVIYSNYASLDDFISKSHALLHSHSEVHVLAEKRIAVCGGEPAWEIEYSHPGTVAPTANFEIVTEQVVAVRGRYTYIASYIHPATDAKRPDADRWVHAFCWRGAQS